MTRTSTREESFTQLPSNKLPFNVVHVYYFFFPPPKPKASPIEPSPSPPSSLSTPNPPRIPLTRPPRPRPLSNLPTNPSTPLSNKPTAAKIWNSGSVSRPHNGFNFFFACGISWSLFFALSTVVTILVVNSFKPSATACSSGDASPEAALALA